MQKPLFEVIVVATMSAGKSTVINALIGEELLHSANEATTATITRIHDKDDLSFFSGTAYSYQNEALEEAHQIDAQTLRRWNADSKIKTIDLVGNIQALHNDHAELVIYDTPGPNNSQDDNHEALTMEVINDGNYGLILYVLNATQLGVNDDRTLLEKIKTALEKDPHKQVIFLLNKADCLDEEKGERLDKVVANANKYLTDVGFVEPTIIPTAAHYALIFQKMLNKEPLTRSEKAVLNNALENLNENLIITSTIEAEKKLSILSKLKKTETASKIMQTGFGVVQYLLQQKLAKTDFNSSQNKENSMSYEIRIEHNPFTIETQFFTRSSQNAEWQKPAENSSLMKYANKRLQLWIETFFEEVDREEFNEYGSFNVIFKGVEADYSDVKIAAEKAKEKDIDVNVQWEKVTEVSERLEQIKGLMKEAQNHPIFQEKINQSQEIQANFEAAFNRDFDVYVAATMSAGKSTFINAMLGCELLPNANEATTATIAQITDNDSMPHAKFIGERYNKNGELVNPQQEITLATLQEWNKLEDTKLIKLEGNIKGVTEREDVRLVISDTPGPNNSQDKSHWETTQKYIQDSQRNPLILYVLNATQLSTNDDQSVLSMIADIMKKGGKQSKDRFIFVINKMDAFDFEKETSVEKVLENVRTYLQSNGISEPLVYPVSALNAGLFRRRNANEVLTRNEQPILNAWEYKCLPDDDYQGIDFVENMQLTSNAKAILAKRELAPAEYRTGIPAIEAMIDEYIDKYNLPNRVNRAYNALKTAIKISSDEQALVKSLRLSNEELAQVNEVLENLRNSESLKAEAKGKIDTLLNDDSVLYSAEIINEINEKEADVHEMLRKFGLGFSGRFSVQAGKTRLARLEENVKFQADKLINIFRNLVEETQKTSKAKLKAIFEEFNNSLFSGHAFENLPLPVLEGLKHKMSNLEFSLSSDEIQKKTHSEKVKVGTRTVSNSTWYKPWTYFSTREEDIYETKYRMEEYVELAELYKTRDDQIRRYFNDLVRAAKEKIQKDTENYLNQFKLFIEEEFTAEMEKMVKQLQEKTQNQANLQQQIAEAEQKLVQINEFKAKLDKVISL